MTSVCDNGCGTVCSAPSCAKGHSYGDWSNDSKGHWHKCSECGETTDAAAHTKGSGTVTNPAT